MTRVSASAVIVLGRGRVNNSVPNLTVRDRQRQRRSERSLGGTLSRVGAARAARRWKSG